MTLYELAEPYRRILDMLDDPDAEMSQFMDEIAAMTKEDYEKKADNYCGLIRSLEGEVQTLKEESDRLTARRRTRENVIKQLKERLQSSMEYLELNKIKTPKFNIAIQNNPPSTDIFNMSWIPDKYLIAQPPIANKEAIKRDLKNGAEIPGVRLTVGQSLRIR